MRFQFRLITYSGILVVLLISLRDEHWPHAVEQVARGRPLAAPSLTLRLQSGCAPSRVAVHVLQCL
jgi:hypothetical protein